MVFFQNSQLKTQNSVRGFTLIESLVLLFLFAIISLTFFQTYAVGTRLIIDSKNRLGATALANQKMEIIRSIDYDAIGTIAGIPAGDLLENETISVNTTRYEVQTFVQYVDDPFDGTIATGDLIPTDYKRVRVTVSWGDLSADRTVALFGNFSPKGVETAGGGGVLAINILDGGGNGVPGASVNIVNIGAGVNVTATTDATGNIMLPGAPASIEEYVLTVTKGGYYGATTFPAFPISTFTPIDTHASVVAGILNQKSIVMEQSTDITMMTQDPFGTVVPTIDYTLIGGRLLGTVPVVLDKQYGFSQTGTTDASGTAVYVDESPGQYTATIASAQYELFQFSPAGITQNAFTAIAGAPTDVTAILLNKNIGSLKVVVRDQGTGNPLLGASVRVSNTILGYDVTVVTDQYGYAYFPTALPALTTGIYDIEVSLAGYASESSSANIDGALVTEVIDLIP